MGFSLGKALTGGLTGGASHIFEAAGGDTDAFSMLFDPGDLSGVQKRKQEKELRKIAAKKNRLEQSRQAAETLRRAQMERAKLLQLGENQGVGDSSAVQGGLGSIQSQAGANLGFANQIFAFNQQAGSRLKKLSQLNDLTSTAKKVASIWFGGIGGAVASGAASSGGSGFGTSNPPVAGGSVQSGGVFT